MAHMFFHKMLKTKQKLDFQRIPCECHYCIQFSCKRNSYFDSQAELNNNFTSFQYEMFEPIIRPHAIIIT